MENKCECYYCEEYQATEDYLQCKHNNNVAFNIEELYQNCNKKIRL